MTQRWSLGGILRGTLPVLLVLTVVATASGLVLDSFEAALLAHPSLLVLVPVTIGTAGSLGSLLAARLSTAFHLGTLSFSPTDETLASNAAAAFGLALTLFPLIGLGAWGLTALTGSADLPATTVVAVAFTSGAVLATLAILVAAVATYAAYRFGLDPDDVVVPVVTNVCDVLGVVVLFGVVRLLVS